MTRQVEDLISQTKDLYVLEQIAAINGSSFAADNSLLAPTWSSSVRKLKSFLLSKPQTTLLNSAIARRSRHKRRPHERRLLLVLAEEANTEASAIKKGMSMSLKWMEEDEGIVGFGGFPRSRAEEVAEEGKMKEDDERFKKSCGDRGTLGCFCILRFWGRGQASGGMEIAASIDICLESQFFTFMSRQFSYEQRHKIKNRAAGEENDFAVEGHRTCRSLDKRGGNYTTMMYISGPAGGRLQANEIHIKRTSPHRKPETNAQSLKILLTRDEHERDRQHKDSGNRNRPRQATEQNEHQETTFDASKSNSDPSKGKSETWINILPFHSEESLPDGFDRCADKQDAWFSGIFGRTYRAVPLPDELMQVLCK